MNKRNFNYSTIKTYGTEFPMIKFIGDNICIFNYPAECSVVENNLSNRHTHDFYNITWVEKGGFYYHLDMQSFNIPDNTILFHSPGEFHSFQSYEQAVVTSIDFSEDYFLHFDKNIAKKLKFDIQKNVPVLTIHDKETQQKIKERIALIKSLKSNPQTAFINTTSIYSALTILLCEIAGTKEFIEAKNNSMPDAATHNLYLSFLDKIEQEYSKHHSAQYYAEELHVGINTLNSCCKKNSGLTPLVIINDRIISEAKRLLLYSALRSSEISNLLGFPEQAHFINFFKRFTKMSPTNFRKHYKGNENE